MRAAAPHRGPDVRERGPRVALELDLDRERAAVAPLLEEAKHRAEVDGAGAGLGEVPHALAAALVLEVHVGQIRDHAADVVDRLDVAVELAIAGVVGDLDTRVADALE